MQNTPRGIDDTATNYEKGGRMYQTAHQNDGFNTLRLYCSKLNPACNAFFPVFEANLEGARRISLVRKSAMSRHEQTR